MSLGGEQNKPGTTPLDSAGPTASPSKLLDPMEKTVNVKQLETIAATVEVMLGAVTLLWAERIRPLPIEEQKAVLKLLVEKASTTIPGEPMADPESVAFSDLAVLMRPQAERLAAAIGRQVGLAGAV
jgi:hypothetical protein